MGRQAPESGVFKTQAISDNTRKDPETGAARPSDESVARAKAWVDENEK